MPHEIKYPEKRTYFVARDADGNVLHVGYTEPNQVTTTGQPVLVAGDIITQIDDVASFIGQPTALNLQFDSNKRSWVFPDDDRHIYIPVDPELIEGLSRGLFKLVAPNREGLYAGIIWHPDEESNNWPVLQLRETDEIPISLQANPEPLIDVLQAFVDNNGLTQEEADGIVGAVQAFAGEVVKLVDFIPPSWQPFVMTKEQVIEGGWITENELLAMA